MSAGSETVAWWLDWMMGNDNMSTGEISAGQIGIWTFRLWCRPCTLDEYTALWLLNLYYVQLPVLWYTVNKQWKSDHPWTGHTDALFALALCQPADRVRIVLNCVGKECTLFCSCDLDLDPMTLMFELDLKILKMYSRTKNELFRSRLLKVRTLQTDRQTRRLQMRPNTLPRRVCGW